MLISGVPTLRCYTRKGTWSLLQQARLLKTQASEADLRKFGPKLLLLGDTEAILPEPVSRPQARAKHNGAAPYEISLGCQA